MEKIHKIHGSLSSISEVKKAPMKFFSISKETKAPVYVLNNNKEVGVILDIDEYNKMTAFIEEAHQILDYTAEAIFQEKTKYRLDNDTGKRYSMEEVVGKDWDEELHLIVDEWE
ncbi:type II toxin-antitoxin system Phd/YefM family antitoxin [Fundicoccus culcitae]|uniref:Antitoxin n=1 Tax=Fundicoccus culcitae TaxID=2969821 RepID=A0ABY5P246_9LACT|nr:type II toxin-antitoxin system Phd/YefM family antitoxin [Fundicoccus culcitae]UUX32782.1 type II toxin-antitoxin system Phd/YefM family antitoxin [Fundicoccus culcitae]